MNDGQKEQTMESAQTFSVYFVNFGYSSQNTFSSLDEALTYAKSAGFEATILNGDSDIAASWSPITGVRRAR